MARFGVFALDLRTLELYRRGVRVPLQDKPCQLLVALLERSGEVVTRGELRRRLWPDQEFLDLDDSLNTAALKLRHALGDSASSPRFIETVPRRGYRFLADVDRSPAAGAARRRWVRRSALGLSIVGLLVLGLVAWHGRPGAVPEIRATARLTVAPGRESDPAWSPEGARIAYASDQLGSTDVWVRQVGAGAPLALTRDHPGYDGGPAWSPDGRWIAFSSDRDGGGIYLIPALGGECRRLLALPIVPSVEIAGSVPTLAWSPDGRRLAFGFGVGSDAGLFVLEVESGGLRAVPLPAEVDHFSLVEPAWSPDGERIAFVALSGTGSTDSRLWSVSPEGVDPSPLTDGGSHDRQPIWSPAGDAIFFLSDRGGTSDLWWLPLRSGRAPRRPPLPVTAGVGIGSFDLSPDGHRLVYERSFERSTLRSLELRRELPLSFAEGRELLPGNELVEAVSVSADGRWLVFDSNRSGNPDIWRMGSHGGDLMQLTRHPAQDWHPDISPQGDRVVFHSLRDGNREIYVVPMAGGPVRRLTDHPGKDWLPRWSPVGEWIAFTSDRGGSQDIWVVGSDGGGLRRLTRDPAGDHNALWSEDGRRIVFTSERSGAAELWSVPFEGGQPVQLTDEAWLDVIAYGWSADGGALYVWGRRRSGEARFWVVRGREVEVLVDMPPGPRRVSAALAVAPQALFFPVWEQVADLWLAELTR